ncbi:MAG: hypothetical protein DRP79_03815 [Planctomycetota bacterium]|nr:MAG: hypothetical protein DRP79_03815 [Planctomycetota bacterium]
MAEATQTQSRPRGPRQKRGEILLRLRPDVEITEQIQRGEVFYVIKDPLSLRYFRISELEHTVASLMDGTNTIEEICAKVAERTGGLQIPKETVAEFAATLRRANLLANTFPDDAAVLFKTLKFRRKMRGLRSKIKNILYVKIPLVDPDKFLNKTYPYFSFIFTKGFIVFAAIVFLLAARIVAAEWDQLVSGLEGLLTLENLFYFWLLFIIVKVIHEMGHAYTCKHYGGEVHEMGLLFLVLTPCLFTNVSDAWTFKKGRAKFFTSFAGIIIELFLAAVAALIWGATFEYPGLVHELSYKIMILCSVTSIIFNGNPLMKFDGYYILSDYLQIPNLRANSLKYVGTFFRKYLLKMPEEGGDIRESTNRILLIYGILATMWLFSVMTGICVGMLRKFYLFGLWITFFTLLGVTVKLTKKAKFYAKNYNKIGLSGRTRVVVLVVLAGLIYLFFFHAIDAQVTSTFVLQPQNLTTVTAPRTSRLAEVLVHEGDWVNKGQPVMRFEDKELELNLARSRLEMEALNRHLKEEKAKVNAAGAYRRPGLVAEIEDRIAEAKENIKEMEEKLNELTVLSPVDGYIISPGLRRHIGRGFQKGDGLVEIGDPSVMSAEIKVEHKDFGRIREKQKAVLKIKARRNKSFEGRVESKSARELPEVSKETTAAAGGTIFTRRNPFTGAEIPLESVFEVTVTVPNDDGTLRKGMTGKASIYYGKTTIAANIWKNLWTWLQDVLRL